MSFVDHPFIVKLDYAFTVFRGRGLLFQVSNSALDSSRFFTHGVQNICFTMIYFIDI